MRVTKKTVENETTLLLLLFVLFVSFAIVFAIARPCSFFHLDAVAKSYFKRDALREIERKVQEDWDS